MTKSAAEAEATTITNAQVAAIKNVTIVSKANAYKSVQNLLNISSSNYLQDYIYYTTLLQNQNSTVLVGVDKAMVNMISQRGL